ncbi:hypothetical protein RvY_00796 [Ramazzottius varieornatus]|uniref:peptidyl-tRNA hydrolase n=1 Tax=Ramazzottius varieornatus TaxID=947166 RepID=A0A1D1UE11_RAMVA|nr:hypothetical protein RvY_00796 [Ramazzottius varieornatus]
MTRGKAAAQCGHAAVGTVQNFTGRNKNLLDIWLATGQTKVVLKVDSESDLLRLAKQAEASGIGSFLVRDAGRTEVANGTVTVLAVGPAEVKDVDAITGQLKLL